MSAITINLFLTKQCNFRCSYCYEAFTDKKVDEIVMDKIISITNSNDSMWFFGGEPMLAFDKVRYLLENSSLKEYYLLTNGSVMTDDEKDYLVKHDVKVQVSYDSNYQDRFNKTNTKTTKKVVENAKKLSKVAHLQTNTVVTPYVIPDLKETFSTLLNNDIKNIHYTVAPEFRYTDEILETFDKTLEDITNDILKKHLETGDLYQTNHFFPVIVPTVNNGKVFSCGAGAQFIAIDTSGYVYFCQRDVKEGKELFNVMDEDIKTREDFVKKLNYAVEMETDCKACQFNAVCKQCPIAFNDMRSLGIEKSNFCRTSEILYNNHLHFAYLAFKYELTTYTRVLENNLFLGFPFIERTPINNFETYKQFFDYLSIVNNQEALIKENNDNFKNSSGK